MIINIRKLLFFGLASDLQEFIARSQEAGFIQFIPSEMGQAEEASNAVSMMAEAVRSLKKLPQLPPYEKYLSKEELLEKAQEVNELTARLERLHEDLRLTEIEIIKLSPFGSFNLDDIHYIQEEAGYKMHFFCRPSLSQDPVDEQLIFVGTEYDLDYFIALSREKLHFPDMIEIKVERSASDCMLHKEQLEHTLKMLEKRLKELACFLVPLEFAGGEYQDLFALQATYKMAGFPLDSNFFTLMAYIPENKEYAIPRLLKGLQVEAEVIKPEKDESLPTCFYNKGLAKAGEDLVKIYDVPASSDKDPSSWVLWTFALFFAMIISDAGYGLIYLLLGYLLQKRWKGPMTPYLKRSIKMIKTLGLSCIIWGVLMASYFGIPVSREVHLKKYSLIEYLIEKKAQYHARVKDATFEEIEKKYCVRASCGEDLLKFQSLQGENPVYEQFFKNILLELSLVVGLIHIITSLCRYLPRNYANLGWVLFSIGGYFYFPAYLQSASLMQFLNIMSEDLGRALGYQLILVGIGLSVIIALIQKKLKGLMEIANVVQVFADILSYLRLYALALASSIMAATFNDMGVKLGLFFGVIVILIGHGINFLLGTMGGVIHGLRLNFIEWYHYSFDGGGKLFKPLKRFTIKN